MSNITVLQNAAQSRGWLSQRFSQSEMPIPLTPGNQSSGQDVLLKGGHCFGLSMIWCQKRLKGQGINLEIHQERMAFSIAAARIQVAMSETRDDDGDDSESGLDRQVGSLGIAAFPGSMVTDILPRWRMNIDRAGGAFPAPNDGSGKRVHYFSFSGTDPKHGEWAHAIAFQIDGPIFWLFDPNYGQFRTYGSVQRNLFIEWFFGTAAYRGMQARGLSITRMRLAE